MSKKNIYLYAGILGAIIVGLLLYMQIVKPYLDDRTINAVANVTIRSAELPLEFTYPSGEFGYTLIEPPISVPGPDGVQKIYLIMDNQAYLAFQSADEPQETPPTISIFVFDELEQAEEVEGGYLAKLQAWASQNPQYSSFSLKNTELETVDLDGVQALRYRTDGLYQQEVYLAKRKGQIFVFTGQFNEETDNIYTVYTALMQSVIFN